MVDHLHETLSSSKQQDILVFFCFAMCSQVDVITSLLAQLVQQDDRRIHALNQKDQYLLLASFNPGCDIQEKELWGLFKRAIQVKCKSGVTIIIDGIDAIDPEPERKSFAIKLRDLYEATNLDRSLQLRCLVTSRPYQPIVEVFKLLNTIDPASEMLGKLDMIRDHTLC